MRFSAAGSASGPSLHEVAERRREPADRDLVRVRVRWRLGVRSRVLEDGARDLDQRADDDVPVLRPDQLARGDVRERRQPRDERLDALELGCGGHQRSLPPMIVRPNFEPEMAELVRW